MKRVAQSSRGDARTRPRRSCSAKILSLEALRRANPTLDDEQGHRARLLNIEGITDLISSVASWRNAKRSNGPLCVLDDIVDALAAPQLTRFAHERLERVSSVQVPLCKLQLYTLDNSIGMLAASLYAGLFAFGSEFAMPGWPLEQRGMLNLELGGPEREPTEEDPGGRIILDMLSDSLLISKRTIKTVRAKGYGGEERGFAYRLAVNSQFEVVWKTIVEEHGTDWLGFSNIRSAYIELHRHASQPWEPVDAGVPRIISIELFDETSGELASAEVGVLLGCCYTCLSLFARRESFPRCDQVRAHGACLLLKRAGVSLIDVGTTAGYYVDLCGFRRTTRAEFLALWRARRDVAPTELRALQESCEDVRSLLEAGRTKMQPAQHRPSLASPGTAITVRGLAAGVTELQLATAFSQCGEVRKARIVSDGFGVVLFGTGEAAAEALLLGSADLELGPSILVSPGPVRAKESKRKIKAMGASGNSGINLNATPAVVGSY